MVDMPAAPGLTAGRAPSSDALPSDYVTLLKPRVMFLVVFTGLAGLVAAPTSINPILAAVAVLAIALQVLINQRYIAYFAMISYYLISVTAGALGLDNPLLIYGNTPSLVYSAMNGYGHFLLRERWFEAYWGGARSKVYR